MSWQDTIKKQESEPTFRRIRGGTEMVKDGKTYYSYGLNEKGTKTSSLEKWKRLMPNYEFIAVKRGKSGEFVYGRKKD